MLNKAGVLSRFSMIVAGALALAVTAFASSAMASGPFKWHPAPNHFTLAGDLTFSQSITIVCRVEVDVEVDANGHATVKDRRFLPGNPLFCGSVVNPFGTWTLTADSPTQVTASVGSSSIAGSCFGNITGSWDNATSTLSFSGASVPGTPGPCTVSGDLVSDDPNVEIK